jgi:hypothetical protein
LRDTCSSLASQPQEPSYQQAVVSNVQKLRSAFAKLALNTTAYEWQRIDEIQGLEFFDGAIVDLLQVQLSENVMTPTVPHIFIAEYAARRLNFLQQLLGLKAGLSAVGISEYAAKEGQAELGFRLPRSFFDDNLDGLIKRLNTIKRLINTFSEIKTGTVQQIEVRDISTSDPMFYFGMMVTVAVAVGKSFSWALDMWKKVEDIRNVRAQTAKLALHTPEELESMFDSKINNQIADSIKLEVLAQFGDTPTGREAELAIALSDALRTVLAIVERGVTLELRYTPPIDVDEAIEDDEMHETTQEAQLLAASLKFPMPNNPPMLTIPARFSDDQETTRRRAKSS